MEFILLLGSPLLGALVLGFLGGKPRAAEINVFVSLATFAAACALTARVFAEGNLLVGNEQFFIDPFNVFLVTLTAFVGLTTSLFSRPYMRAEHEHGRISAGRLRLYHGMFQLFMFTMLAALTTNNLGLMWVAMEAATLSTVLLVTLYRTPASLEAGWKYFILCGVGIAQALFGTILLYFAAEKVLGGEGVTALLWTHLDAVKGQLEPAVLALAFVFLLVGYGTKVGLAPLHNWLPDAHAEGPTPISAVLSGLLLNVALYAVVRCKVLVEGSLQSTLPSNMLMGFGLLSIVLAAFFLWRQRDIKRLFAYSSIEHMGIITFAFGLGGPVANFAALLHMTVHSLTKSAIFYTIGHATQMAGTQLMEDIRGLYAVSPAIGWGLMVGSLAILGLPPFGIFASEFLILTTAMHQQPWATPILLISLGVAFAAIFGRVQPMVFGETNSVRQPQRPALVPVFVHLAIVLMLGLYVPPFLADWYREAAVLIGGH
ncbi:MAG: formate hydrogenlyase subunit 3/multisubunit Na+/H+ antiporter, MnhD subunit [Steroidobacteraceae bacterium]|nr:formate hydrogenlyase subunit 3/multisubunit Na+/H+ antiporter, MnhD subunit [Steroidobacteraceae bacterium]